MNAFIQNYDGQIAIYSSAGKELIRGGFATVADARNWAINESIYAIVWVATAKVVI